MFQLFREILKPAFKYFSNADFREWIYVKSKCRNKSNGGGKNSSVITLKIAGFIVFGNNASSFQHQYHEIFVRRSFDVAFQKENPVIICCGANIGLEIFFFKKNYPQCKILAIEADPEIFKILSENVSRNNLKNVELIAGAAWKENGTISFTPDGALGGKTGTGNTSIKSIRLADKLKKENEIDLLIIDIEGGELEVLNDCKELNKVARIFVEWHGTEKQPQKLNELLELLSQSGFRYRLNNNLPEAPFTSRIIENNFDAMVEIYAEK